MDAFIREMPVPQAPVAAPDDLCAISDARQSTGASAGATSLDHILQTELPDRERGILAADKARWERLGSGAHLDEWMHFADGLRVRRALAMKVNFTNQPKGRGYTQTYGQLLRLTGFDIKDRRLMTTLTAVAWLDDKPERVTILREVIDTMSPGERSRLNSPISARQRVEKILRVREGGNVEEKLRESPIAKLKTENAELTRTIADLQESLAAADGGDLFNWKTTPADKIAATIVGNVNVLMSPAKARAIATEILRLLDDRPKAAPKSKAPKKAKKANKPTTKNTGEFLDMILGETAEGGDKRR